MFVYRNTTTEVKEMSRPPSKTFMSLLNPIYFGLQNLILSVTYIKFENA